MSNSTTIKTRSGQLFDLASPHPDSIELSDIVIPLCNLPRYTAQTMELISVASHSLALFKLVPRALQPAALLHDAAEAYTGDISAVIKSMLTGEAQLMLLSIELEILTAIEKKTGIDFVSQLGDLKPYDTGIRSIEKIVRGDDPEDVPSHCFDTDQAVAVVRKISAMAPAEVAFEFTRELMLMMPYEITDIGAGELLAGITMAGID